MYNWSDVVKLKSIKVFGKTLMVDPAITHVCIDADGSVGGWATKPSPDKSEGMWVLDDPKFPMLREPDHLGTIVMDDHIEDWYNLMEEV